MVVSLDAAHFNELLALVEKINTQIGRPELITLAEEPKEVTDYKVGCIKLQELSAAATSWLATESVNRHIRSVLAYRSLGRWLERDTWTPREALSILAGLDPARSSIEWTRSNSSEATIASPIVQDACFFADWRTTFFPPHSYAPGQSKSKLLTAIEDSRAIGFEDAAQELIRKVNQEQESAFAELELLKRRQVKLRSEMLKCISQRWYSSSHYTETRQIPEFFIEWAEALGFQIEWLSWARGENLLDTSAGSQGSISSFEGGQRRGGSEKHWTKENLAELAAFRATHSMKETAERFGISDQRIRSLIAKHKKENTPTPTMKKFWPGLS